MKSSNFVLFLGLLAIIDTITLWIVSKFSEDPANLFKSFIGAIIIELGEVAIKFFELPSFVSLFILLFVLIKFCNLKGTAAFFAMLLYGLVKTLFIIEIVMS